MGRAGSVRVLGLVTEAYGGQGGIAQYNRDFWSAVAGLPQVAALDLLPRRAAVETEERVEAPPAPLRMHPAREARAAYAAAALRLARRARPDIVVCGHLFMAPLAALVARLAGARLAIQLHGIEIWREPSPLRRRALERADLVLCVSRDTRARLLAAADIAPERVVVLPNTVADDYVPAPSDRPWSGPRILLSVGRLDAREAYKGQDAVIACLPELGRLGHDVVYRIAGDGDDRPRLTRLAQHLGVPDRVEFLGTVARAALPDLYREADLFVLPSRGEGFGIVFLEAMACGVPALGLAVGGAVDALDGLGLAVPQDGLAAALAAELDRTAASRGTTRTEALDRAARVRARFGRPRFAQGVAQVLTRLRSTRPADDSAASRCPPERREVPAHIPSPLPR